MHHDEKTRFLHPPPCSFCSIAFRMPCSALREPSCRQIDVVCRYCRRRHQSFLRQSQGADSSSNAVKCSAAWILAKFKILKCCSYMQNSKEAELFKFDCRQLSQPLQQHLLQVRHPHSGSLKENAGSAFMHMSRYVCSQGCSCSL